jgi:hypothetical protein
MKNRDDFNSKTTQVLAKRASFICSNPVCRCLTVAASEIDEMKFLYTGTAAHITAAAEGGPRYDASLTPEQRSDISNAIFLCSNCAEMIDKNKGMDFPTPMLQEWKNQHEAWVRENLNKSIENSIVVVDGEHHARGIGNVTGLEIKKPAIIQPGTIVTADGIGNITGTKIE